tara:strand:+ start:164 stop:517 length:354 start_codon:yes stop_codon:yes gene_type:complete
MQNNKLNDELDLAVLKRLSGNGKTSQRNLSSELNVSLGAINYCIKALIDKGLIKVKNFRKSNNKLAYIYLLTPNGFSEKVRLTRKFLTIKRTEYLKIQTQIKNLENDLVNEGDINAK